MIVAAVVLSACAGDEGAAVDQTSAVVAVSASGCRLRPVSAVGVVVGEGLVATVAHSVAGEDEITVRAADGVPRPAVVAAIDTALDAAVLRVDGLDVGPVKQAAIDAGSEVDLVVDDDGVLTPRRVRIVRRVTIRTADIYRQGEHSRPGFEVTADVQGGDSGAPLFDASGDVVGLIWAASRRQDDRAWALPIEALDPLLAAATASGPPPLVPCAR